METDKRPNGDGFARRRKMAGQQRHEIVVNALAKQIFLGKLKPETKLPTEKQLSQRMKVDRTSLRLGLKQLESMNVLSIRQGDGIYVKDYLKNAGLDFLALTFQQMETESEQMALDAYLMDEILEFWSIFFPPLVELALKRASTRDLKLLAALVSQQEKSLKDRDKMVEIGVAIQDKIAEVVNNTIVLLLFNSCRPLRKKVLETLVCSMDEEGLKGIVESERVIVQSVTKGSEEDVAAALDMLRQKYVSYRRLMKELMSNSLKSRSEKHRDGDMVRGHRA